MIIIIKNIKRKFAVHIFGLFLILSIVNISCEKQVSVSPPDAPPPNGYVYIKTNPEGFHIYLNGKSRRRATADSLTWLSTGQYQITLKKDLFRDTSFTVDIVEGEKRQVYVDYTANKAMLGSIECSSNPSGADIFLGGKYTGRITPATLYNILPGYYYIRYKLKNHRDDSVLVTVRSSVKSSASVGLLDTTIWNDYTTERSGIFTNLLTCVAIDKDNNIWIGSENQGILKFDGKTWERYTTSSTILPSNYVNCISIAEDGTIWVGTKGGLAEFKGSPHTMSIYTTKTSKIPIDVINAVAPGAGGVTWLGTPIGLVKTWIEDGTRQWYTYSSNNSRIPDTWINSLTIDSQGKVWAGTKYGGIYTAQPYEAVYNRAKDGLPSDNITASALAGDGSVWFTHNPGNLTGAGLSFYLNNSFQKVYDIPNDAKLYSIYIDRADNKWVGSSGGLLMLTGTTTAAVFNKATSGLDLNNVMGIAQDAKGLIWIAANGTGLILYKKAQ